MVKMVYLQDYYKTSKSPRNGAESVIESILGSCLYRKNEEISNYTIYKNVLQDYLAFDIYKCFHMTIDDYLNLTPYEKNMIDEVAEEYNKQVKEAMEKAQKEGEAEGKRKYNQQTKGGHGIDELAGLF